MTVGRRPGARERLTDADLAVLGLLYSGPMHGHGMWNRLTYCDIEDWAGVSRAQVYYSLSKLAKKKLITLAKETATETARERQTWRITPEGRRALKSTLASDHWTSGRRVSPFVTWVGWSELASPAARKKNIAKRRAFLEEEIERERETLASAKNLPTDTPALRVTITMVEYAIRQLQLELDWLEELEGVFEL
ncbi:MAG: PadR family transcriptional regulator [Woeseiaceae bacterium]|nr:PadR family transcriptional regulator [Woeseiaceae bacterium]